MSSDRQHVQDMEFRTQEDLQTLLILYRDSIGLIWSEIAQKAPFLGHDIPLPTLHYIYTSGKVPKRYWKALKIKGSQKPRIAISKDDMIKARNSIVANIPEHKVRELWNLLSTYLDERER